MNYFPQEILIEIFQNIQYGRKQLSLVSKSFYNAISFINEDNVWLEISSKNLNDESTYKSIIETSRRIRNIEMRFKKPSGENKRKIMEIIQKQSNNITRLKVTRSFPQEILEEFFKLITKLNLLDLKSANITNINSSSAPKKKMKMSEPSELNSIQVKKLMLPEINEDTSAYIFKLMLNLEHATLVELEIVLKTRDYRIIHELIQKQPNLKVLKLEQNAISSYGIVSILPPTFLSNCNLEHLSWNVFYATFNDAQHEIINSILKRMKTLKILKFYHTSNASSTEKFNTITSNMEDLESLTIFTRHIETTAFANLSQLRKLRNLTLNFSNDLRTTEIFSILSQLEFTQLQSFSAPNMSQRIDSNIFQLMSTFLQNITNLKIEIPHDMVNFQAVFQSFPQVESLTINRKNIYTTRRFMPLNHPRFHNFNLRELIINVTADCSVIPLRELCRSFPNIEKLSLKCVGLNEFCHILLLKKFKSLKYLNIDVSNAKKSTFEKRMNAIFKHGQNLEVVIYEGEIGSRDILKMFEQQFEYIKITDNNRLTIARNLRILHLYQRANNN